jgi:hypothetical protein
MHCLFAGKLKLSHWHMNRYFKKGEQSLESSLEIESLESSLVLEGRDRESEGGICPFKPAVKITAVRNVQVELLLKVVESRQCRLEGSKCRQKGRASFFPKPKQVYVAIFLA